MNKKQRYNVGILTSMEEAVMEICDILKSLREKNHLTQDQLAERVMVCL